VEQIFSIGCMEETLVEPSDRIFKLLASHLYEPHLMFDLVFPFLFLSASTMTVRINLNHTARS
jgi:hypothetical protein